MSMKQGWTLTSLWTSATFRSTCMQLGADLYGFYCSAPPDQRQPWCDHSLCRLPLENGTLHTHQNGSHSPWNCVTVHQSHILTAWTPKIYHFWSWHAFYRKFLEGPMEKTRDDTVYVHGLPPSDWWTNWAYELNTGRNALSIYLLPAGWLGYLSDTFGIHIQ